MEATWIELGGYTVHSPVTVGTNLLLAIQCILYSRSLSEAPSARARYWKGFFWFMSVATLAGAVKHGFRPELGVGSVAVVLWVSSLATGLSTFFAQMATAVTHDPPRARRWMLIFSIQFATFVVGNVVFGPTMLLIIANTACGLLPVIVVEARASWTGYRPGMWVASGLIISIGTSAVYLLEISLSPWFNHVDIAHVLMGVSYAVLLAGSRGSVTNAALGESTMVDAASLNQGGVAWTTAS